MSFPNGNIVDIDRASARLQGEGNGCSGVCLNDRLWAMKVLCVGGTGYLGQYLVEGLKSDGHDVAFTYNTKDSKAVSKLLDVEHATGYWVDLATGEGLRQLAEVRFLDPLPYPLARSIARLDPSCADITDHSLSLSCVRVCVCECRSSGSPVSW